MSYPQDQPVRFFNILVADATYKSGAHRGKPIKETKRPIGRYKAIKPWIAAHKAAKRLFKLSGLNDVTFVIRETTSGSDKGHYVYSARIEELPTPVTYTYKNQHLGSDGKMHELEFDIVQTHKTELDPIRNSTDLRRLYKTLNVALPPDGAKN